MRQTKLQSTFFIDAICLNQNDEVEIASQLPQMRDIYRNANEVVVWLGMPDTPTIRHLAALQVELSLEKYPSRWPQPAKTGFEILCDHPFWTRMWIVQEVILAKKLVILYGPVVLWWSNVSGLMDTNLETPYIDPEEEDLRVLEGESAPCSVSQELMERRQGLRWGAALKIFQARERFRPAFRSPGRADEGFPIHVAFRFFGRQHCTKDHDRLYGLLGVIKDALEIKPDYKMSSLAVFKQAWAMGRQTLRRDDSYEMIRLLARFPLFGSPEGQDPLRFFNEFAKDLLESFFGFEDGPRSREFIQAREFIENELAGLKQAEELDWNKSLDPVYLSRKRTSECRFVEPLTANPPFIYETDYGREL
ncbi:heterokaryon incompatibility protein-domain-containing protein [Hypoxylon rubiginosum]|uniref:Heterokaryon incompatibility protein-domain-containing protein n=1 Tax=Hypoxylon rubiginosum TaxID=110542 RepID=A0ACB9YI69_9PEZI|nr:heterokaryon incompatibility protein-domain-containing protein [Hypoxylon rubiginosum]